MATHLDALRRRFLRIVARFARDTGRGAVFFGELASGALGRGVRMDKSGFGRLTDGGMTYGSVIKLMDLVHTREPYNHGHAP